MSYLDATFLNDYQASKTQTELRTDEYGIINAVKSDTPNYKALTPQLEQFINTAMGRTFTMPAIKEQTPVTATVESFTIPANISESETTTASLVTLFSGFHWYDALANENMITKEDYISNKLDEIFKGFALAKEATTLTAIDGQKTQVLTYNPLANDGITFGASTLTATLAAQKELIFSNLNVIAESNGLMDQKIMVSSPGIKAMQNWKDTYGSQNSRDLTETGAIPELHTSNRVTNAARWTGYMWDKGSFAYVNNFKHEFVKGETVGDFAKWDISSMAMPYINEQVMTYIEEAKADASGLQTNSGEYIMSKVTKYAFVHRYLILTPYNSDITTRINPVVKIVGSAA
jgi:hypothetical protein